jgi:hypothetical protein
MENKIYPIMKDERKKSWKNQILHVKAKYIMKIK